MRREMEDSKNALVTEMFGFADKRNGIAPALPITVQKRTTIRKPSRAFNSWRKRRLGNQSNPPKKSSAKKVDTKGTPAPSR